jgi:hypothetical protein
MGRYPTLLALALVVTGCGDEEVKKPEEVGAIRKYTCRRAEGKIKIDGKVEEEAWKEADLINGFSVFWEKRKARTATAARLLWDDRYLYFAAEMEDEDLFALEKAENGMTWEDDVFELFFKPSRDKLAYYELQVNPLGTKLELYLPSRGAGGYRRFHKGGPLGLEAAVALKGTLNKHDDRDRGWSVEGRIPWKAFNPTGGGPDAGDVWKFALCRYDYSVTLDQPELSSCAPLTRRDFHRYEDYADLVFLGARD